MWCGHPRFTVLCRLCPPCLWSPWAPPAPALPSHTLPGILTHGSASSRHPQAHDPPAGASALICVPRTSYNLGSNMRMHGLSIKYFKTCKMATVEQTGARSWDNAQAGCGSHLCWEEPLLSVRHQSLHPGSLIQSEPWGWM